MKQTAIKAKQKITHRMLWQGSVPDRRIQWVFLYFFHRSHDALGLSASADKQSAVDTAVRKVSAVA